MYDLVVMGGTVVDGTGGDLFEADVALVGDRIAAIDRPGALAARGRDVVDARGAIVTPGWVDIHTHYDGQVTWDDSLAPTSWHGVTTAVMGNCGVGFAPVLPDRRDWLVQLMEGVEDIPGAALLAGMPWAWETFPEYLDHLRSMPRALDVGVQIAHGPLRTYVMGERGARNERATSDDIDRMAALVREALAAGALGFSTSRTLAHRALDGEPVPGTFAELEELFGIGAALGAAGFGQFQLAPAGITGTDDGAMMAELSWMRRLAAETRRPVSFGIAQVNEDPTLYRRVFAAAADAAAHGVCLAPQVSGRPGNVLFGVDTSYHPFQHRRTWKALAGLDPAEKLARLRQPAVRDALLADVDPPDKPNWLFQFANRIAPFTGDLEPPVESSLAELAERQRRRVDEVLVDLTTNGSVDQLFMIPVHNYATNSLDAVHEMMLHPQSVAGLSDGGAHCAMLSDASAPTTNVTHWTRDRTRGPRIALQHVVRKQTMDTAQLVGLRDRGVVAVGRKADVNVIDYDALRALPPRVVHDLPARARRIVQRAEGYRATIVSGTIVALDGEDTGARPGRLATASDREAHRGGRGR